MAELLPCPRCGAAATTIEAYVGDRRCPTYTVRCNNIRCEMEGSWGDTREDAEQWWNARTPCPDCAGKDAEIKAMDAEVKRIVDEKEAALDQVDELTDEISALRAVAEAARKLLSDLCDLMEQSRGVAGLHLNGDESSWEELTESADFGSWLGSIHAAQDALAALDGIGGEE